MPIDYSKYPLPRIRHHTNPNFYLPREQMKYEAAYYPPLRREIDWRRLFANGEPPAMLDIGCGLGQFLMDYSQSVPEDNLLGVELRRGAVEWVENVITSEKLPNAAVLWYSVANGLPFLQSASLSKIFYFFPDPWYKLKHQKRRAFNAAFLDECARVLRDDGALYLMTDVPEVDDYQRCILDAHPAFDYRYIRHDGDWEFPFRSNQELFCQSRKQSYVRLVCPKRQQASIERND